MDPEICVLSFYCDKPQSSVTKVHETRFSLLLLCCFTVFTEKKENYRSEERRKEERTGERGRRKKVRDKERKKERKGRRKNRRDKK